MGLFIFVPEITFGDVDMLKLRGKVPLQVNIDIDKVTDMEIPYSDGEISVVQGVRIHGIDWVVFEDAPVSYSRAIDEFDRGDFVSAFKGFMQTKNSSVKTKKNWLGEHLDFYIPLCLYELSRQSKENAKFIKPAHEGFEKFIKEHPKSIWTRRALYELGKIEITLEKYKSADSRFEALISSSSDAVYKAQGRYGQALNLRTQKKTDESLKICQEMLAGKNAPPELLDMLLEMLLDEKKDFAQADLAAEALLRGADDPELLQKAFELKGCAQIGMKQYQVGLESLLKSELMYSDAARPVSERTLQHIAIGLLMLMKMNEKEFPAWEYKPISEKYLGRLKSAKAKSVVQSFVDMEVE